MNNKTLTTTTDVTNCIKVIEKIIPNIGLLDEADFIAVFNRHDNYYSYLVLKSRLSLDNPNIDESEYRRIVKSCKCPVVIPANIFTMYIEEAI